MSSPTQQTLPLRRRSGPVTATVTGTDLVTPALRRVFLSCPDLTGGAPVAPAAWVRGYFPNPGPALDVTHGKAADGAVRTVGGEREAGAAGAAARAYTMVGFDPTAGTFALDFVLHGRGPAALWAAQVQAGQTLRLAGPLGRGKPEPRHQRYLFAGDTTALPAIREWVRLVPPEARSVVHVWAPGPEERQPLSDLCEAVTWHYDGDPTFADLAERGSLAPEGWGPAAPDVKFFVAGEAGLVTRARRALTEAERPAPGNLHTSGYWRRGQTGEP